jgi:hypothetical protein
MYTKHNMTPLILALTYSALYVCVYVSAVIHYIYNLTPLFLALTYPTLPYLQLQDYLAPLVPALSYLPCLR